VVEDLRAFWDGSLRNLAEVPMEAQVEPAERTTPGETFRVTLRGLSGVPFRAYLALPRGRRPGERLPAVVTAPGYGGRMMGVDLSECMRGYAILQVYPRGQGESGELWRVDPAHEGDWLAVGAADREGYYYQGGFLDLVRGIDWLLTRDDIDPRRIGAMGTSQSGGMVIALGALDRRVAAIAAHVPFVDRRGSICRGRNEELLRTFASFEPLNLAAWVTAPTLLSAGGKDEGCPAAAIRDTFDRLAGIKALAHYPQLAHTSHADFLALQWEWMDRHVRDRR
jgi:cephalosporin-C deacetylase